LRSNESRSRRQPATPLWAPVAAACSTRKVPRVAARARPGRSAGTPVLAEARRRPVVRCAGLTAAGGWQQRRSSRAARVVAPRASTVRIVTACVLKQVPRSDARFLAFAERLFRSLARGRLVPPLRPGPWLRRPGWCATSWWQAMASAAPAQEHATAPRGAGDAHDAS